MTGKPYLPTLTRTRSSRWRVNGQGRARAYRTKALASVSSRSRIIAAQRHRRGIATPQDVRWAWDAEHVRGLKTIKLGSTHPLDAVQQAIIDANPVVRTRVVPRGEHRTDFCLDFAPWPGSNAGDLDTYAWRCAPKWLRGRLTHAQRRRERARTHVHITAVLPGLIEGTLTV